MKASTIPVKAELSAVVIRANGKRENIGVLKPTIWQRIKAAVTSKSAAITVAMLLGFMLHGMFVAVAFGLVTTAGVNYMAAEFAGGASLISAFKWHDCGTGTVAAAIGDTGLGTPAGTARVSGTGSSTTNVFQSVATISFTSSLAITEWGLFSASTAGTLLDRRVFAAINVVSGDSIQFTYQLTVPAGGS